VGLGYHLTEWRTDPWIVPISLVRLLAIIGGAFLLMGRNWARWLILAWMAFHVVVSAFHSISECVAHLVCCWWSAIPPDPAHSEIFSACAVPNDRTDRNSSGARELVHWGDVLISLLLHHRTFVLR